MFLGIDSGDQICLCRFMSSAKTDKAGKDKATKRPPFVDDCPFIEHCSLWSTLEINALPLSEASYMLTF